MEKAELLQLIWTDGAPQNAFTGYLLRVVEVVADAMLSSGIPLTRAEVLSHLETRGKDLMPLLPQDSPLALNLAWLQGLDERYYTKCVGTLIPALSRRLLEENQAMLAPTVAAADLMAVSEETAKAVIANCNTRFVLRVSTN